MNFQKNTVLKNYSSYRIGGPAHLFTEIASVKELKETLRLAKSLSQSKIAILGGGTNVLISDKGFDGLVIHNKINGMTRKGNNLEVGSGVLIKDLLDFCIENSLSGLEWAGGLPGTIGGAVRGNAGAFKGETKDSVLEVKSLDLKSLSEKIRNNFECQFSYRNSVFKEGVGKKEFITLVVINLKPGNKDEIQKQIQEKIDYRNLKHPMNFPNIGSTFKNIPLSLLSENLKKEFEQIVKTDPFPVVPTTKLLALCDLKGRKVGGAMISNKHPNFIINIDNATSKDINDLIKIAKNAIDKKYKINLEEEIIQMN